MNQNIKYILVVDDEAPIRSLFVRTFKRAFNGIEICEAGSGSSALQILNDNPSNCLAVVLDGTLPDIHGLDILAAMRKDTQLKEISVIVVSGDSGLTEEYVLSCGAVGFVQKPCNATPIIEKLQTIFAADVVA